MFIDFLQPFVILSHPMQYNADLPLFKYFGQLGVVCGRPKIEFHQQWSPYSESAPTIYSKWMYIDFLQPFVIVCHPMQYNADLPPFRYFGQLGVVWGG